MSATSHGCSGDAAQTALLFCLTYFAGLTPPSCTSAVHGRCAERLRALSAQVCLKQHMFRNSAVRRELLHCNLFLYVEPAAAAAGGAGQVVWSAMHPRTVTTGVAPSLLHFTARLCALGRFGLLRHNAASPLCDGAAMVLRNATSGFCGGAVRALYLGDRV